MNRQPSLACLLLAFAPLVPATAQTYEGSERASHPRVVQPPQMPGVPGMQPPRPEAPQLLSRNYRISFSGKQGEKQLGTLSALTCSPTITLTGTLEQAEIPTLTTVSGRLEEDGERVVFQYSIGFRVPVPASTMTSPNGAPPVIRSIEYQEHQCSGTVRMQPGKNYELLKSGPIAYSVTIAPEQE